MDVTCPRGYVELVTSACVSGVWPPEAMSLARPPPLYLRVTGERVHRLVYLFYINFVSIGFSLNLSL